MGGGRGQSAPLTAKRLPKSGKGGKEGKNRENREEVVKKRKNQEERAKIWKVLSLCPS